uniref:Uncharacterized protein n=1 Tax=Romanomermis culicivorax TaxID=13658 RepID=A0A915JVD5_ROMCU
MLQKYNHPQL